MPDVTLREPGRCGYLDLPMVAINIVPWSDRFLSNKRHLNVSAMVRANDSVWPRPCKNAQNGGPVTPGGKRRCVRPRYRQMTRSCLLANSVGARVHAPASFIARIVFANPRILMTRLRL
jgi:hypothetical protein